MATTKEIRGPNGETANEWIGRLLREKNDLIKRLDYEMRQTELAIERWDKAEGTIAELKARLAAWEN